MKKVVIGAVALVIISQLISTYYLNRRLRPCGLLYYLCEQACDDDLEDALERNDLQRGLADIAHGQALTNCLVENVGDAAGLAECREEADTAFRNRIAEIDGLDAAARQMRGQCVSECSRQYQECNATNEAAFSSSGAVSASVDVVGTVSADCFPGAACFEPVSDLCQQISGVCDQCTLSLCGGGEWTVETVGNQLPVTTTLVAATDLSKNPRVLATSTTRGNQAILNVPPNIKLGEGEQLYFGLGSQNKGRVELRIRRSK